MINTASVTDLKQNTASLLKRAKAGAPILILQRSEPAVVLVDPDYYQALEAALEDLEDIHAIEQRRNEPNIPFNKYFARRFKSTKAAK